MRRTPLSYPHHASATSIQDTPSSTPQGHKQRQSTTTSIQTNTRIARQAEEEIYINKISAFVNSITNLRNTNPNIINKHNSSVGKNTPNYTLNFKYKSTNKHQNLWLSNANTSEHLLGRNSHTSHYYNNNNNSTNFNFEMFFTRIEQQLGKTITTTSTTIMINSDNSNATPTPNYPTNNNNPIKITAMYVNSLVSLSTRLDHFNFLKTNNLDITLVSVTKLNQKHKIQFKDFNIIRSDRPNGFIEGHHY
ncbi:hypothetical protein M0804_010198 [Polistes exclamans]|nr:hypothetical protein M0804_010198 [Polistes exclamans]